MFDLLTVQGVCLAVFGALLIVVTVIQAIRSVKILMYAWGSGGFLAVALADALILAFLATLSRQAFLSAQNTVKSAPQTTGKNYTVAVSYTLVKDGCIGLARDELYEQYVPEDIRTAIDEIEQKLIAGEITVTSELY